MIFYTFWATVWALQHRGKIYVRLQSSVVWLLLWGLNYSSSEVLLNVRIVSETSQPPLQCQISFWQFMRLSQSDNLTLRLSSRCDWAAVQRWEQGQGLNFFLLFSQSWNPGECTVVFVFKKYCVLPRTSPSERQRAFYVLTKLDYMLCWKASVLRLMVLCVQEKVCLLVKHQLDAHHFEPKFISDIAHYWLAVPRSLQARDLHMTPCRELHEGCIIIWIQSGLRY